LLVSELIFSGEFERQAIEFSRRLLVSCEATPSAREAIEEEVRTIESRLRVKPAVLEEWLLDKGMAADFLPAVAAMEIEWRRECVRFLSAQNREQLTSGSVVQHGQELCQLARLDQALRPRLVVSEAALPRLFQLLESGCVR
jgi:hypothetical protein